MLNENPEHYERSEKSWEGSPTTNSTSARPPSIVENYSHPSDGFFLLFYLIYCSILPYLLFLIASSTEVANLISLYLWNDEDILFHSILFTLLTGTGSIRATTTRLPKSFIPEAVKLLNTLLPPNSHMDQIKPVTATHHPPAITAHWHVIMLRWDESYMLRLFTWYCSYTSLHSRFTDCTDFYHQILICCPVIWIASPDPLWSYSHP